MSCDNPRSKRAGSDTESPAGRRYEWREAECPSTAFVQAVADATGRDPIDMPPLYEFVDTDALNDLMTGSADGPGSVTVTVTYDGVTGQFDSDGELLVLPAGEDRE